MNKSYNPEDIEQHWYRYWEEQSFFEPAGGSPGFCIMLPPPNVTGSLHMGHAFQDTIMDTLTRWNRMKGADTLWQPGTDHAGIATQMVVERQLLAEGKSRHDLGREAFVDAVWEWKEHSGDTISEQMRRLGTSVAWSRHRFTMDEGLSEAVRQVFVQLYSEGLIYRGKRLVNWDPVLHTALSDLEVISEEENGKLWHIRYPRKDGRGHLVVATTRPETLLGDTAVAVNPEDDRYRDIIGLELELPLTGRTIPIIADDYVDQEFGSGCVKITPAHDFNDYEMGKRHDLAVINVLNDDATMNENAPEPYRGMDRFDARKKVIEDLKTLQLLEKIEDHKLMIPRGDRSHAVVEPYLTDQWYVSIAPLAGPAIEAVESGRIEFVPSNWSKTYFDWMHRIEDWCISRQLWWGHRIPAWYDADGNIYVGLDEADARERSGLSADIELRQDEDVLDTWFSSALWPFSTLGWPERNEMLDRFYPTSVMITGFDIIFFWVARMIMMGLKFMEDVPFRTIYIHGLIRDSHGQKMSKSKGNVLDPLDLINGIELQPLIDKRTTGLMQPQMAPAIEKITREEFPKGIPAYGTDALRFTFASLATTGRDIRFELGRIEGNRNFCNKLWNAARFVLMQTEGKEVSRSSEPDMIDTWIVSRVNRVLREVDEHLSGYRLDLAAQSLYEFIWNEYCDWYLEFAKSTLSSGSPPQQANTRYTLLSVLEISLRALHPIMPFITEDIWQRLKEPLGLEGDTIMLQPFPVAGEEVAGAEDDVEWLKNVIQGVRRVRSELDLPPGKMLDIWLQSGSEPDQARHEKFQSTLFQLGRIQSSQWVADDADSSQCAVALVGDLKILIPLKGLVDVEAELARLQKQLAKEKIDLKKSEGKLGNKRFVQNAPEAVVEQERQRLEAHKVKTENLNLQIQQMESMRS